MSLRLRSTAVLFVLTSALAFGQKPPADPKPEEAVDKEYLPLVKQLKDKDAKVRLKAAVEISEKGEAAASTATALCDAIMDISPRVAEAALVSMEKIRPDLYRHLSPMILDKDRYKQFQAIAGLGLLGEKAMPAKKLLLNRLRTETVTLQSIGDRFGTSTQVGGVDPRRHDSAVLVIMSAIEQMDPDNADVHKVRKSLASAGNKVDASRLEAIDSLIRWAGDDEKRRKEVLPIIGAAMQDQQLLIPAINRLGAYEGLSKAYLPTLKKLKLASDEATRVAATKAVDAIEGK